MKILVTDPIAEEALEKLKEKHEVDVKPLSPEELLESIQDYDALVIRTMTKVTSEVIDRGKKLRIIGVASIGVDHVDVAHAKSKELIVANAPTGSTFSVAELAIGHIISLARHIPKADRTMKEGLWEKKKLRGTELYGKTLGIIGLGRIGKQVALRAKSFGMNILAYDPYVGPKTMMKHGAQQAGLDELLMKSDIVTIHVELTDETRGMIGIEKLRKMKRSAFIINAARGPIINEKDLATALDQKLIAGAALDVYEEEPPKGSPLLNMGNVVLTPHLGASTIEGQKRAGMLVAEDVLRVLDGKAAENVVELDPYSKMKRYID